MITPLEKAILDTCEKFHAGLSAVEDETKTNTERVGEMSDKLDAQQVLLNDIMRAIGSLSDLSKEQYNSLAAGLSSLGARVRTSEQLMRAQARNAAVRVVEIKKGRNESDDR